MHVHPTTGYIEVDLVAVEKTENSEVEVHKKTYGIDQHVIKARYNGDVNLWLTAMRDRHIQHSGDHKKLAQSLLELKGKEI